MGQTTYVDGLVMEPQKMATKAGKKHEITRFSDIEEWRYVDSELTMEAFMDREDVKAIINDPDSTLLPLGVNPLDQSLVSYDLSKGTLYTLIDEDYSSINLNIRPYSENRAGFSKYGAYTLVDSQAKTIYHYVEKINRGGGEKQIIQFSDSYGTLFSNEEEDNKKVREIQKENLETLLEEGPSNQVFPILKVEVTHALSVLNQSVLSRGYLIQDFDSIERNETNYQISNNQIINPLEVANSMVYVKGGKAITIKIPR